MIDEISDRIREKPRGQSNFTIWDALEEHRAGARISKAARKDFLHAFVQFPTSLPLQTEADERALLAHAVNFVNNLHGGNAVFHARLDRDERGRHGVDVFYAPRYMKKTGEEWVSLSRHSKELARDRLKTRVKTKRNKESGEHEPVLDSDGEPVMVWNDSPRHQGIAMQQEFYEYLRDEMKLDFVVRGEKKHSHDPDWRTPEQMAAAREAEKKLRELEAQAAQAAQEREEAEKALTASRALLAPLRAAYGALVEWKNQRPLSPAERLELARRARVEAKIALNHALNDKRERDLPDLKEALDKAAAHLAQCQAEMGLIVEFTGDDDFIPGKPAHLCNRSKEPVIICRNTQTGERLQVHISSIERMKVDNVRPRNRRPHDVAKDHETMLATLKSLVPGDFLSVVKPTVHDFVEKAVRCYAVIRCGAPRFGSAPPLAAQPFSDLPEPVKEALKTAFEAEDRAPPPVSSPSGP